MARQHFEHGALFYGCLCPVRLVVQGTKISVIGFGTGVRILYGKFYCVSFKALCGVE
jgi:hypothetical protein